jgi:hypothetical protein
LRVAGEGLCVELIDVLSVVLVEGRKFMELQIIFAE